MVCSTKVLCPQKPVIEKIAKIQTSCVLLCGHTTFVLLTAACTAAINDKITIFCNDLNKTSTCVKWKSGMDIMRLCIHSSLTNCFDEVIFLCFGAELKFHILSTGGKMSGLSPSIKVSILSKSGHSTFVLSAIDIRFLTLINEVTTHYGGQSLW